MPKFLYGLLALLCLAACQSQPNYQPKPYGYHRLELPAHEYVSTPDSLPYTFEYSKHAQLLNDTSFVAERYWLEIYYPKFTANIDVSYKVIRSRADLRDYVNDCFKLAQKHNVKAQRIEEIVTRTPKGYTGVMYQLEGEVPTTFQFFITDSSRHFLRTSLYFPTSIKNDSLAPFINFVKADMVRMMNTLQFK